MKASSAISSILFPPGNPAIRIEVSAVSAGADYALFVTLIEMKQNDEKDAFNFT